MTLQGTMAVLFDARLKSTLSLLFKVLTSFKFNYRHASTSRVGGVYYKNFMNRDNGWFNAVFTIFCELKNILPSFIPCYTFTDCLHFSISRKEIHFVRRQTNISEVRKARKDQTHCILVVIFFKTSFGTSKVYTKKKNIYK